MSNLRRLTDEVHVGGQIMPADLDDLIAAGFKAIINNRPDAEAPGQPSGEALGEAAKAAKLGYEFIPMHGLDLDTVNASVDAYEALPKPIAAFCASGTRSVALWCFACVKEMGIDSVLDQAMEAGFNMLHIRPALQGYLDHHA